MSEVARLNPNYNIGAEMAVLSWGANQIMTEDGIEEPVLVLIAA